MNNLLGNKNSKVDIAQLISDCLDTNSMISTPLYEIQPDNIELIQIPNSLMTRLQPRISKCLWKPNVGRRMSYLIVDNTNLLGTIFLGSPIMTISCRDKSIGLDKIEHSEKGKELRHYLDMNICVGIQPISWYWNLGKLCAMLATTITSEYKIKYGDELKGIFTTSYWGKSTGPYNRIYKFLGYTKGISAVKVTDEEMNFIRETIKSKGYTLVYGKKPKSTTERLFNVDKSENKIFYVGISSPKRNIVAFYNRLPGIKKFNMEHGNKRGVYFAPSVPTISRHDVIKEWYIRWGKPRFDRKKSETPPYKDGLS